ncbi:28S ribosomal protein S12, mitochondrial [Geodia barretti]|uniref:Small ribosomal subunit protein uS12m n=4 Tax=Geodia barretti TaxID=519541 RepID=A0AA35T877_GEOBA|nr:28S ribosomal protein S12, mitochondrial [Geodia barretti]
MLSANVVRRFLNLIQTATTVREWPHVAAGLVPAAIRRIHTSPPCHRTVNQIIRNGPVKRRPKPPGPMSGRPQMKGIILQTMIRKPKKPNSANRKCCRVRLSNGKEVIAFIPREGHSLQEHNVVLVEGGRTKDLPGVNVRVVRGKYDCAHPVK